MISLNLKADGHAGKADLLIDYTDNHIGFTVVTEEKKQFDFGIEREDWETFKNFIESQFGEPSNDGAKANEA